MSIVSAMPSNHLILCHPLLLWPSIFPSIRVFSSELALGIMWLKYWSFSFIISPSNGYLGLISYRIDGFDLLAVWGTLKGLFQHHSLKASILLCSAFFMVQPAPMSVYDCWKNYSLDYTNLWVELVAKSPGSSALWNCGQENSVQNNDLCKGRLKQQLFNSNTHWKRKSGPEVWAFHYEPNFSSQGTKVASHGRVLGVAKSPSLLSWLSGRGNKGEMGFPEHWQVQERPSRQSKSKSSFITVTTQVSRNSPLTGKEWVRENLPEGTGNVLQVLRCLPKSRWRQVVTFC